MIDINELKPLTLKWHERLVGVIWGAAAGTVILAKAPEVDLIAGAAKGLMDVSPVLAVGTGVASLASAVYATHFLASRFTAAAGKEGVMVAIDKKDGWLNLPQIRVVAPLSQQPENIQNSISNKEERTLRFL